MKCPKCGKDNPIGSKFCNDCGEKLPEQNLEQIWKEVQENSKKSTPIFKDVAEPEPAGIKKPESKLKALLKKNETLVCGIIGGVVVLVIVLIICLNTCNCQSQPQTEITSDVTPTETVSEVTPIESLAVSDLDKTEDFYDIKFKVSSNWDKKESDNKTLYFISGEEYYITLERQKTTDKEAKEYIDNIPENDTGKYIYCFKDKVNGVTSAEYSYINGDYYTRTSSFYYSDYLYSVSLTANSVHKNEVSLSFPVIRSAIIFGENNTEPKTENETEPETEKPTPEPTEVPKPTEPIIDNPTSTGGWGAHGTGDYVAEGLNVEGYAVLTINYYGDGNFSVVSYENGDDYDDLLVNEIGNYSGRVLIDHGGKFDLEINADGEWTIETSGLSVDDSTSFSGTGDCVTGITTHSGGNWEITNDGDSNFAVIQYGVKSGYMDLMVNEIGYYQGTVKSEKAQNDNIFFEVNSDGNWTIKRK